MINGHLYTFLVTVHDYQYTRKPMILCAPLGKIKQDNAIFKNSVFRIPSYLILEKILNTEDTIWSISLNLHFALVISKTKNV